MTTENRRKEEREAKTENSGRNSLQPLNSAMVGKAEREESLQPDNQRYIHIPKIEGVVNDYNMRLQEERPIEVAQTAWYEKKDATFSDLLTTVRKVL
jgi:hypothetical protein